MRFTWLKGYDDPATPDNLDRVGVLKIGSERARNVLVLNPGTSAGAGVLQAAGRRHRAQDPRRMAGVVGRAKGEPARGPVGARPGQAGPATPQRLFDYYLGWLTDPEHHQPLPADPRRVRRVPRGWG